MTTSCSASCVKILQILLIVPACCEPGVGKYVIMQCRQWQKVSSHKYKIVIDSFAPQTVKSGKWNEMECGRDY